VRTRGELRVYSTFSQDGTLTMPDLGRFYARRGLQFVAIGERSQDLDATKVRELVEQSPSTSNAGLLIVPGIEFTCGTPGVHILRMGARGMAPNADADRCTDHLRAWRGSRYWHTRGVSGGHVRLNF
jgi:hypothetical protein